LPEDPTATQDVALAHETPLRVLNPDPWLGLGTIDQTAPFHDSTSVVLTVVVPTAVQSVEVTQLTALSCPPPLGVGVGVWAQFVGVAPAEDTVTAVTPRAMTGVSSATTVRRTGP